MFLVEISLEFVIVGKIFLFVIIKKTNPPNISHLQLHATDTLAHRVDAQCRGGLVREFQL